MEKSIAYEQQINNPEENINVENWHYAVDSYEKNEYRAALRNLFSYIDDRIVLPESEEFEIKIPHGSIILEMKVENGKFYLKAPFVKIPEDATGLAILRQATELNFTYLILSQIVKVGDELYFQYEDKLENCEPYKMYSLFEEICYGADYYDDIFISKYKASFIQKPELDYFSQEQKELAFKKFQEILTEALSFGEYLENKRYYASICDLYATSLAKLDYIFAPQGILGSDLNDILNSMYEEEDAQTVFNKTKGKLKKLLEYEREKFDNSLFYPKFFIPQKRRAELPLVQDFFKNSYENSANSIANNAFMSAGLVLYYAIYDLFYRYRVPLEIEVILEKALKSSSSKDWDVCAHNLYAAIEKIIKMEKLQKKEPNSRSTARRKTALKSSNSVVNSVVNKIMSFFK